MKYTSDDVRSWLATGQTIDGVLSILRDAGMSPLGSIRLIMDATGMDLAEAKATLARCSTWTDIHGSVDSLHDDLERVADELRSAQTERTRGRD